MANYVVIIQRDEKVKTIILRDSDYTSSVTTDRANNIKLKYGSGKKWDVLNVMDQEAYQNQTDSEPFKC